MRWQWEPAVAINVLNLISSKHERKARAQAEIE
jgi:hypothetical protein